LDKVAYLALCNSSITRTHRSGVYTYFEEIALRKLGIATILGFLAAGGKVWLYNFLAFAASTTRHSSILQNQGCKQIKKLSSLEGPKCDILGQEILFGKDWDL
jgi:hypothetical protein